MIDLILRIIQLLIIVLIIALEIILLVYIVQIKSKKPTKKLKRIAIIEKYKIDKKILYKIIPKKNKNNKFNIIYFHGGAYSSGLNKRHWNFVARLCDDVGANIFVPDYPLIPKNTYKDVFGMVDKIYNNYIKQDSFIVIGDSAGGGISLAFSQKLVNSLSSFSSKLFFSSNCFISNLIILLYFLSIVSPFFHFWISSISRFGKLIVPSSFAFNNLSKSCIDMLLLIFFLV